LDQSERKAAVTSDRVPHLDELLSAFVDASPDPMLLLDADWKILCANAGASATFGLAREDIVGLRFGSLISPCPAACEGALPDPEAKLDAPPTAGVMERVMRRPGGDQCTLRISIAPVPGTRGLSCATLLDLTERDSLAHSLRQALADADDRIEQAWRHAREASARLAETEARFRLAGDTIREVFWISDPGVSRALYVNGAYEDIFGRSVAELYEDGAAFFRSIHRQDRERIVAALLDLRRGRDVDVEYRIIAADGTIRWLRTHAVPVRGSAGTIDRVVGVAEDVTEQKKRDDALRFLGDASRTLGASLAYEETLQRIASLAVPALADWCAVDVVDGEMIRRVTRPGRGSRSPAGDAHSLLAPDIESTGGAARVLRTGEPELHNGVSHTTARVLDAGAEQLGLFEGSEPCSAMIVPMTARGRVLGAITLASTESGRVYDERDLELACELAARAAAALDNAQLYEQAVLANRAKSDFLALVSHELRTPLNAISSYSELLQLGVNGPLTKGQAAHVRGIRANTEHLIQIIDQILMFSQLEVKGEEPRLEWVDLTQLVRDVATIGEPLAAAKGLRFIVSVPRRPIEFESDRGKVMQILLNLVSNAVKFTEQGEIELSADAGLQHVLLAVRDTGIGIPADRREQIFDPFWQAEQLPARRVGGTGLGLSVSRRLAQLLGGRIAVDSEVGVGTTFTVQLPLGRSPVPAQLV